MTTARKEIIKQYDDNSLRTLSNCVQILKTTPLQNKTVHPNKSAAHENNEVKYSSVIFTK